MSYVGQWSSRLGKMGEKRFLLLLVTGLAGYWLLFQHASLSYYWNYDDFHLIRPISSTEIAQSFAGNWDPSRIETAGFRPFTILFNDFRYSLLGESPAAHRLFLLGLMASLLWLAGWIALRFGLPRRVIAIALLVFISTKSATGDIVWISDGIHIFQWWALAFAMVLMIHFADRRSAWLGFLSLTFLGISLTVREDSLVALLLMPIFFLAHRGHQAGSWRKLARRDLIGPRFLVFWSLCLGLGVFIVLYRHWVVPEATTLTPTLASAMNPVSHLIWSSWITGSFVPPAGNIVVGLVQAGSKTLELLTLGWGIMLGGIVWIFLLTARRKARWQAGICFLGQVAATAPALNTPRANLLLLPTLMFCFALAIAIFEVWSLTSPDRQPPSWASEHQVGLRSFVVLVCVLAVAGSVYRASAEREDMAPLSVNQIRRDYEAVYAGNADWARATPAVRRDYIVAKLNDLGANQGEDQWQFLTGLFAEAAKNRRYSPGDGTKPFYPRACYLSP